MAKRKHTVVVDIGTRVNSDTGPEGSVLVQTPLACYATIVKCGDEFDEGTTKQFFKWMRDYAKWSNWLNTNMPNVSYTFQKFRGEYSNARIIFETEEDLLWFTLTAPTRIR